MLFLSGILSMLFFVGFSKPHTTRHHHYPCAFVDVFGINYFAIKEVTNLIDTRWHLFTITIRTVEAPATNSGGRPENFEYEQPIYLQRYVYRSH